MTDQEILHLAVDHFHIDCDRMPHGVFPFARAIIAQARAELIGEMKVIGWMRVHTTPGTPYGPAEHDIDIHIGDDMPEDGRPWTPLSATPDA